MTAERCHFFVSRCLRAPRPGVCNLEAARNYVPMEREQPVHTVLHSARGQLFVGTAAVRCVMRPRRRRAVPGGARSGPWATRPKRLWSVLACWSPWARPHGAARPSSLRKPAPSAASRAARLAGPAISLPVGESRRHAACKPSHSDALASATEHRG